MGRHSPMVVIETTDRRSIIRHSLHQTMGSLSLGGSAEPGKMTAVVYTILDSFVVCLCVLNFNPKCKKKLSHTIPLKVSL